MMELNFHLGISEFLVAAKLWQLPTGRQIGFLLRALSREKGQVMGGY